MQREYEDSGSTLVSSMRWFSIRIFGLRLVPEERAENED